MTSISLEYFGMHGSGRTVKAAREEAGKLLSAAMKRDYTPWTLRGDGIVGFLYATPYGYSYTLVWPDAKDGKCTCPCTIACSGDRDESFTRMAAHIAQCTWSFESDDTPPSWLPNEAHGDYARNARWHRSYKRLRDAGLSDVDAHRQACGDRVLAVV